MKKIRIGNQTAYSASSPLEPFEYALKNNFDAFEWFPDRKQDHSGWDEKDIDNQVRDYIKRKSDKYDVSLSVHAPWNANPLNRDNHEIIVSSIRFGSDIGATLLNIHLFPDEGIEKYIKSIIPVLERTNSEGMILTIENTTETTPDHFNQLFSVLNSFKIDDRSIIGMCLDVGHANLSEACRNDYLRFIDLLEPHVNIIHVHMHENYGDSDSHLPIFTGPARLNDSGIKGFAKRLKDRNFSGSIILEQWPEPVSLLVEAREKLRNLMM